MGCLGWGFLGVALVVAAIVFQIPYAGPFLALVIVVAAIWFYRLYKNTPAAATTPPAGQPTDAPATLMTTDATPPATIESVRLFSRGRQGVAGEYYRAKDLARVVGRRRVAPAGDWDSGLRETALLEREPRNQHDRNAVKVRMAAGHQWLTVGYLPREVAARWQQTLKGLESRGVLASCLARIYKDGNGGGHQVVLRLSNPESAVPGNGLPEGATVLDAERECAVTGEQQYQDALSGRGGWLGPVWATLHPGTVPGGKQSGAPTVEARVDGQTVGTLTAAQGERYGALTNQGAVVACEAEIFEGTRGREVRIFLPKVD